MIPDYQTIMLPLLKICGDGKEHALREATEKLAADFGLSATEREQKLPSGQQTVFGNRVGWARTYMKKAGLLETTRRAFFKITARGREVLDAKPSRIDGKYLNQFAEFKAFKALRHEKVEAENDAQPELKTPEEALENAYEDLRSNLASEILQRLKSSLPGRFEKTVVELIVRMGYGGSLRDAGQAIGKSGDEGIDGIIKEDRLGLDVIYVQAKRWGNTVSRPEIQKFAGALQGQRAKKGIFITTSDFTKEATEYAARIDNKIILIDGEQLAELMIDYNIGVTPDKTYELKRVDSDYFEDD
ncbi:MAG: Mrr restriction system protein [Verrucomicrobiae bacterium]|nr:Mrr restriction system protein [Verrucomicrobiae bacterium]